MWKFSKCSLKFHWQDNGLKLVKTHVSPAIPGIVWLFGSEKHLMVFMKLRWAGWLILFSARQLKIWSKNTQGCFAQDISLGPQKRNLCWKDPKIQKNFLGFWGAKRLMQKRARISTRSKCNYTHTMVVNFDLSSRRTFFPWRLCRYR